MRNFLALLIALAVGSAPAVAQPIKEKFQPPEIKKVHVGFKTYKQEDDQTAYKVGLWTPIYIEVFGGTEGIAQKPTHKEPPHLSIVTSDSDDVGTTVQIPILVEPLKERVVMTYIKTGHLSMNSREVRVTLHIGNRELKPFSHEPSYNLNPDAHLYVTLGPRMTEFHQAVRRMDKGAEEKDFNKFQFEQHLPRHVAYENDVQRLPDRWFGYNGVDLLVLGTDQGLFLNGLNLEKERLAAIAQWVRRGGRLVVPIAATAQAQQAVHALFTNEFAWQPPLPVVPPKVSKNLQFENLSPLQRWAGGANANPFVRPGGAPIPVATLDPGNVPPGEWEVFEKFDEKNGGHPMIARVRYGLGQITYIALSFQDENFFRWEKGKQAFLEKTVTALAPRAPAQVGNQPNQFNQFGRFDDFSNDPATRLLAELDKFGVTPIDFGYVALFIILYILIVGPLDFFLLKFVFKRLEWTWITFPTVVLGVSVIAYFAAYALKGKDLKVNKVDIVDFDLRTSRDQTRAYGTTMFSILSPRIQNYTIGVEPNPKFWGGEPRKVKTRAGREVDEVLSTDLISWLGRPSGGPGDMGRSSSGGFFKRPYSFIRDESNNFFGIEGVPIPVWTTKAFTASWEQQLGKPPFVADLVYHQKLVDGKDLKVSGKLENHLGVDLVDVWLAYNNHFFLIEGGLKSVKNAQPGRIEIADRPVNTGDWVGKNDAQDDGPPDGAGNAEQTRIVKQIMFQQKVDIQGNVRNHLLRPLDLGWRMREELRGQNDRQVREAILFGRVRVPPGAAESVIESKTHPVPTKLWLGDLPNVERERQGLSGQLNQDTYIRVIVPVRPAD